MSPRVLSLERTVQALLPNAALLEPQGSPQIYYDRGNKAHHFGAYFEHLIAQTLGGTVLYPDRTNADIYDSNANVHREVKATASGKHTLVVMDQFVEHGLLANEAKVEHCIVRHQVKAIESIPKNMLHEYAAASEKLALVTPHSILARAINLREPFTKFYVWGGLPMYTLSASLINGLTLNTGAWLQKLGLSSEAYSWQQFRTPSMNVLGYDIAPFVFTRITEKE